MKVIVSHDVDHLSASEHGRDLMVPKFILRNVLDTLKGGTRPRELLLRCRDTLRGRWQNLDALMHFDSSRGIPATYFIAVENGLGLSYSLEKAKLCIAKVMHNGFDVGVHGIAFDSSQGIREEYRRFESLSGLKRFGIRMHYLRHTSRTLELLDEAGYTFDSSICALEAPRSIGNMVEFPLHIMDAHVLYDRRTHRTRTLSQAKELAKRLIGRAGDLDLPYLTLLFHDIYFCEAFGRWREWYCWTIEYLASNGIEFTSYRSALAELQL
jgi:hypothetical protein